ncbi:MAG TPA: hypothetical protein VLI40_12900 [Gemmatimonadaceae bacterium]|nr:hypothetical protein [Gemmatimonadaceae bacterium]
MRRLITLLLCLLTASGARSGFAVASQNAPTHGHTSVFAAAGLAADTSHEVPAADPAWTAPAPVVIAPVTRGVAPHAVGRHGAPVAALALVVSELETARGRSAVAHHARLPLLRRGYHATGPPKSVDMSPFTNSLARPA